MGSRPIPVVAGDSMSYLIAAYGLAIGTLVAYGVWVQGQRRALERAARSRGSESQEP
jgi:hypothetical protein